ncbi:unnamed protein product, partial [Vitis vinifera]
MGSVKAACTVGIRGEKNRVIQFQTSRRRGQKERT